MRVIGTIIGLIFMFIFGGFIIFSIVLDAIHEGGKH